MRKLALAATLIAVCLLAPSADAAPLSKQEKASLKREAAMALQSAKKAESMLKRLRRQGDAEGVSEQQSVIWNSYSKIPGLLDQLSEANDKKTWKFIAKIADILPDAFDASGAVRKAAESMTEPGAQAAMKRSALRFKKPKLRRALVLHMANKKEWGVLIGALKDKDEDVAALAAWRLIDNRVESAVEPMIAQLEKLERDRGGIWDVLRKGLGDMLGMRCSMAIEYTSLWEVVQEKGGLAKVSPPKQQTGGGEVNSGVRLFGREIDCTRVVFILDVSGSMEAIDRGQSFPNYGDGGSRVRDAGDSSAAARKKKLKTRLQRAQRELKHVLNRLPANFKVNVIAFSSRVKMWRSLDGDKPPGLHKLSDKNRKAACKFVDSFRADGVTCTDTAILRGFDVKGARCFYLLSDGFATHDGRTPVPTEEILGILDDFKDRHITVHTLGFSGADVQMMQAVADHTGGKYSDIK